MKDDAKIEPKAPVVYTITVYRDTKPYNEREIKECYVDGAGDA